MSSKKNYDKSFKQQAIQLALSSNQPISKTAKDLGVLESTLYSWVHKAKAPKTSIEPPTEADVGKMQKSF